MTVHPHARGAYSQEYAGTLPAGGSSPRTWGLHGIAIREDGSLRFIPTHVGLTAGSYPAQMKNAVHPHARGAYAFWTFCPR